MEPEVAYVSTKDQLSILIKLHTYWRRLVDIQRGLISSSFAHFLLLLPSFRIFIFFRNTSDAS
jgi:hypothetical protein